MIAVLICDHDNQESALIGDNCRKQTARYSDQSLRVERAPNDAAFAEIVHEERTINFLYYEFRQNQSIDTLREFRRRYEDAMFMLITDSDVSPLEYLRPGIAPDALLLRPVTENDLNKTNREFFQNFFEKIPKSGTGESFLVDTRDEKLVIPYSRIYYFESRGRKIHIRTKNGEYAFYAKMDTLTERLPAKFQRCHRSYIVNTDKILRAVFAENYLELTDKIGVPISRGYKVAIREALT